MANHDNKYTEECEDIAKKPYFECLAQGKLFSECFEIYEDMTRPY
jgi:hypothetical protein